MDLASYRDPGRVQRVLDVSLTVFVAMSAVVLVESILLIAKPVEVSYYGTRLDDIALIASVLLTIAYVVSAITWIVWLQRCHRNVIAFGLRNEYKRRWAIFGWIVPIGSLWIPFRMMEDVSISANPQDPGRTSSRILPIWWGLFLFSTILGRFLLRSDFGNSTFESWAIVVSLVSDAMAALVALPVLQYISKAHQARHQALNPVAAVDLRPSLIRWPVATSISAGALVLSLALAFPISSDSAGGSLVLTEYLRLGDCTMDEGGVLDQWLVVDCEDLHVGQIVGTYEIVDRNQPSRRQLVEFVSDRCREELETSTGIGSEGDPFRIRISQPTVESWENGDRRVLCLVYSANDAADLVGTVMDPVDRVAWSDLQEGTCYSFKAEYLTLTESACAEADIRVEAVIGYPNNKYASTPYPGQDALDAVANSRCSTKSSKIVPTEVAWPFGDRTIVCVAFASAGPLE